MKIKTRLARMIGWLVIAVGCLISGLAQARLAQEKDEDTAKVVSSSPQYSRITAELKRYIPANAQELSVVVLGNDRSRPRMLVAAWSKPSKTRSASFSTTVIGVRWVGRATRLVRRFTLADGYSPKVMIIPAFLYEGNSIALVQLQLGAAASRMEAVGTKGSTIRRLGSIKADYFDFTKLDDVTYVVAHQDVNLFDIPQLYRWTGVSFADDSAHHPEFYKNLAAKVAHNSDITKFAPAVQLKYAQLLRLSNGSAIR